MNDIDHDPYAYDSPLDGPPPEPGSPEDRAKITAEQADRVPEQGAPSDASMFVAHHLRRLGLWIKPDDGDARSLNDIEVVTLARVIDAKMSETV